MSVYLMRRARCGKPRTWVSLLSPVPLLLLLSSSFTIHFNVPFYCDFDSTQPSSRTTHTKLLRKAKHTHQSRCTVRIAPSAVLPVMGPRLAALAVQPAQTKPLLHHLPPSPKSPESLHYDIS